MARDYKNNIMKDPVCTSQEKGKRYYKYKLTSNNSPTKQVCTIKLLDRALNRNEYKVYTQEKGELIQIRLFISAGVPKAYQSEIIARLKTKLDFELQEEKHECAIAKNEVNRTDVRISQNNLNHNNKIKNFEYRHFIISQKRRLIESKEIFETLENKIKKGQFVFKKIIKPLTRYMRISLSRNLGDDKIDEEVKILSQRLDTTLKEVSLKKEPKLENLKPKKPHLTKILSLNINGIKDKTLDLELFLKHYKPDIICLQETKRKENEKNTYLSGYTTFEIPSSDTGNGLLIASRQRSAITLRIVSKDDNLILFSATGNGINQLIANCYKLHPKERRIPFITKTKNILKKHANEDIILVGDWNDKPNDMIKILNRSGISILAPNKPTKGTRANSNLRRTTRTIDYGLTNNENLIIKQKVKTRWKMSDHLPILIKTNIIMDKKEEEKTLTLHRKRLN